MILGGSLKKNFDPYQIIYFNFKSGNKNLFLLSNNLPLKDRENIKIYHTAYTRVLKNIDLLAIIPTFFLYKSFTRRFPPKYKASKLPIFIGSFAAGACFIRLFFKEALDANLSYYLHKYMGLAKENLLEIDDPRRKFFRVDTSEYYRDSLNDIVHPHGGHDDGHAGGHGHHDTTNYYGPHPVIKI